jgi:uncharacterized circularly permuted ATP-grasp superfamily protein/uncharacterized alpha-E superfamily protein
MAFHPERHSFCELYAPPSGNFDEMCTAGGKLREHWEYFIRSLQALGSDELERRRQEGRRLLRENGVTYNVYQDRGGLNRPWELDPLPLLISSQEWSQIEAGLIQRAELLNLILADLYGPRALIRKGLLPLELVYTSTGFLRACDQIRLPGTHQLIGCAADLARGPDTQMWVLGDRTSAPSGAGYALENRIVMSRILPSLFRDSHVHRVALFFRSLRTSLANISMRRDDPRIVVLTPGPRNETYFEHAYLASYLGYTLAQGGDLTVRDGQVWLKAVGGLEPVDVLLRRVDDPFCDPLELRHDSQLGVPGLVEAARRGNVCIVNPLGSAVLENPGLLPFLPRIAEHFLGQPLRLPSVASWWCGQRKERDYVLANLERLVIKPINAQTGAFPVFGSRLATNELELWRARIRSRPQLYVGQEEVSLSSVPALSDGGLEPRRAILRTFLVARDDSYVVMPGGLTRIAPEPQSRVVSNQAGALSKDTWVLASEPEKQVSLWLQPRSESIDRDLRGSLPSRAAENLFWFGRYAERAEATIRLLRAVLLRLNEYLESGAGAEADCLHRLLQAITQVTASYPGFVGEGYRQRLAQPQEELLAVILDSQRNGSLTANLQLLVQAAYSARDLLSSDTWRIINNIEDELASLRKADCVDLGLVQDELDHLITALLALSGLSMESTIRGQGWYFLDIGKRIERTVMLSASIRSTLVHVASRPVEDQLLESVLRMGESLITYRRRYRSHLQIDTVLDLLLQDPSNPRALVYQLERLQHHVVELRKERWGRRLSREEQLILEAFTLVRLADTPALVEVEEGGAVRDELDQLLSRVGYLMAETSDVLTQTYFAHAPAPQQLVRTPVDLGL